MSRSSLFFPNPLANNRVAGDELFMFSPDYSRIEGGRHPLKRFELSTSGSSETTKERFHAQNFVDLVGGGRLRPPGPAGMRPSQISGKERPMALDPQRTALLVIDVQNDYFDGAWRIPEGIAALGRIEEAIEASQSAGATVVYIQHAVTTPEFGLFLPGSYGFALHPRLHPRRDDPHIVKHYPGSFNRTELESTLRQRNIDTIVISGYMTHMCCDTTAREGFQRDFRVLFLDDATATRDGQHATLGRIDHKELHRATLITQASMFAQVVPTSEYVAQVRAK